MSLTRKTSNVRNVNFFFLAADISTRAVLHGALNERDGQKYMTYQSIDLKILIGGGTVKLENLFNSDKVLRKSLFLSLSLSSCHLGFFLSSGHDQ